MLIKRNLIEWRNRYNPNRCDNVDNFSQTVKNLTNTFKENRDCLYRDLVTVFLIMINFCY